MRETTRRPFSAGAPTLLLTRPEAQSRRFAAEVARLWPDLAVILSPAQEIRPLPIAVPQGTKGIVLTSENAVPALPFGLGLPAYCVGERTAAAAAELPRAGLATRALPVWEASQPASYSAHSAPRVLRSRERAAQSGAAPR